MQTMQTLQPQVNSTTQLSIKQVCEDDCIQLKYQVEDLPWRRMFPLVQRAKQPQLTPPPAAYHTTKSYDEISETPYRRRGY
jgi:hypothetical protein